jgi:hypothetical protein
MRESFKKALSDARIDLEAALIEEEALQTHIARLRQIIATLAPLCDEEADATAPASLKDALREALRAAPIDEYQVDAEIEKGIMSLGYDTSGNKNIRASIHTTATRMVEDGELEPSIKDGKKAYRLKRSHWVPNPLLLEQMGLDQSPWFNIAQGLLGRVTALEQADATLAGLSPRSPAEKRLADVPKRKKD